MGKFSSVMGLCDRYCETQRHGQGHPKVPLAADLQVHAHAHEHAPSRSISWTWDRNSRANFRCCMPSKQRADTKRRGERGGKGIRGMVTQAGRAAPYFSVRRASDFAPERTWKRSHSEVSRAARALEGRTAQA